MRKYLVLVTMVLGLIFIYSFRNEVKAHQPLKLASNSSKNDSLKNINKSVREATVPASKAFYDSVNFGDYDVLNFDVFDTAFTGFENLKKAGHLTENSRYLVICDFSLSSNKKRLWVIDMVEHKVVYNTLVSHGKGTGEEFAEKFSNIEGSHQSSLGFYITETTYNGSNGYSLLLNGMDKGYNDAAMQRAIVMHGADYVSEAFIKSQKRLGRSWGCPAVSREIAVDLINLIKEKNCLFIYYPDQNYLSQSQWLS